MFTLQLIYRSLGRQFSIDSSGKKQDQPGRGEVRGRAAAGRFPLENLLSRVLSIQARKKAYMFLVSACHSLRKRFSKSKRTFLCFLLFTHFYHFCLSLSKSLITPLRVWTIKLVRNFAIVRALIPYWYG